MGVIVEFSISADTFAFGSALDTTADMHVTLEKIVPTGSAVIPYFWVEGREFDLFERSVEDDPNVADLALIDRFEDSALYRARWRAPDEGLLSCIVEGEGVVLEASASGKRWYFQLRFPTHDDLTTFYDHCESAGIPLSLERVYTLTQDSRSGRAFELTPEQREALVLALNRGYFAVPSEATLEDLAAELDISQQAVSMRIRRANEKVLRAALMTPN